PKSVGISPPQEPIRDISVSVLAKVPTGAELDAYRKRLEVAIESLSKQPGLDEREARVSAFDAKGQPAGISIPPSSALFPNPKTEPKVFAETCNMFVWLRVFKDNAKIERRLSLGEGDLRFMAIFDPFMIKQKPTNYHLEGPLLNYDIA